MTTTTTTMTKAQSAICLNGQFFTATSGQLSPVGKLMKTAVTVLLQAVCRRVTVGYRTASKS